MHYDNHNIGGGGNDNELFQGDSTSVTSTRVGYLHQNYSYL